MVFCGGIGENAWRVREQVFEGMGWIGIDLDRTANRLGAEVISSNRSGMPVFVIRTEEEAMIARHAVELLAARQGSVLRSLASKDLHSSSL